MRLSPLVVTIALATSVTTAAVASSLKSMMKAWKGDGRLVADMVGGKATFNAAEYNRILTTFASDSNEFETRIKASTSEANDLKARFAKFGSDAAAAIALAADPKQAKGRIASLLSDCKSCHDAHAN